MISSNCLANQANATKSPPWFASFSNNVASQFGEDGIIEQIFNILTNVNKWCVEFGAADGRYCSNTFNLIQNKGYSAVLIEPDPKLFRDLKAMYQSNQRVSCIKAFVGFDQENGLDALLKNVDMPQDFDLLSIDIEGNDYHCWKALRNYRPKVVVIEYNPTIPNNIEFVQAPDMRVFQGSSILSIKNLASSKGYEMVAATFANAIFVDSVYFDLFGIQDNSLQTMRLDESAITYLFSGFDGTLFLRGYNKLPWHEVNFSDTRIQQLPKWLRQHPCTFGLLKKVLLRAYRGLRAMDIL